MKVCRSSMIQYWGKKPLKTTHLQPNTAETKIEKIKIGVYVLVPNESNGKNTTKLQASSVYRPGNAACKTGWKRKENRISMKKLPYGYFRISSCEWVGDCNRKEKRGNIEDESWVYDVNRALEVWNAGGKCDVKGMDEKANFEGGLRVPTTIGQCGRCSEDSWHMSKEETICP